MVVVAIWLILFLIINGIPVLRMINIFSINYFLTECVNFYVRGNKIVGGTPLFSEILKNHIYNLHKTKLNAIMRNGKI